MKFVIDMMGGDNGTSATVPAVRQFKQKHPNIQLIVVGKENELNSLKDIATIIHADDIIPMEAGPMEVMRARKSSMYLAIQAYQEHNADAIISSGSTGGFLSIATLKIKMIEGIERAALVAPFPTLIRNKFVTILDIGANAENNAHHLTQFALMGRLYAEKVFGIENPTTYLLSNGSEPEKGSVIGKEAHHILVEEKFPNFKGNIEAKEALHGHADVIVCDGFAGNVLLKSIEGTAKVMSTLLKEAFKTNLLTKIGYLFTKKGVKDMRDRMDYKKVGGAMLLGINGVVVKAHGNSDVLTFFSALEVAYKMAANKMVEHIKESLKK